MKKMHRGFTLIEVMVVVAIIGILASVALPSYSRYIQKTRRSDATQTILEIAALEERRFFTINSYTTNLADLQRTANSTDGYYTISVASNDVAKEFTITATANNGPQIKDTDCRTYTITQAGVKGSKNSSNVDSTATCWGK